MATIEYKPISLSSAFIEGFAVWYVNEPWPELAYIQDYDVPGHSDPRYPVHKIHMECENGTATFEVIERDRYGGYSCKLLPGSTYSPKPKR